MNCKYCKADCAHRGEDREIMCSGHIHITNADRIRAMSDEELADWLVSNTVYQESAGSKLSYLNFLTGRDDTKREAIVGTIEWLQQPAEEVDHE